MTKPWRTVKGEEFIVDDRDYALVKSFKWVVLGRTKRGKGGAIVMQSPLTLGRTLLLGQLIKKLQALSRGDERFPRVEVDHINGNPFDNRRKNLRIVSRSENSHFKWKRFALERLRQGIKCSLRCDNMATSIVRLPTKRYLYLCDDHLVTSRRRKHAIQK